MRSKFICTAVLCAIAIPMSGTADAAETWARTTMLLEPAPSLDVAAEHRLIPGGLLYSDDIGGADLEEFDAEAVRRIEKIGTKIAELEAAMRLEPVLVRQYQLVLAEDRIVPLPALDLNPRLGTSLVLNELTPEVAIFDVEFFHASGDWETPEFTGEPIILALEEADLRDVLETFSKVTGRTIVIDPAVEGTISVDFREVPWDRALDVILTVSDLGWVDEGDSIWVSPLEELNRRREVLAKAAVAVNRSPEALAMVASRNGPETPTVALIVELLEEAPPMPARHAALVRFRNYQAPAFAVDESEGGLVVVRFTVTEDGGVVDPQVLASPSEAAANATLAAAAGWRMAPILDGKGRHRRAVVAFGIRVK